jgi:hypothetical protein
MLKVSEEWGLQKCFGGLKGCEKELMRIGEELRVCRGAATINELAALTGTMSLNSTGCKHWKVCARIQELSCWVEVREVRGYSGCGGEWLAIFGGT